MYLSRFYYITCWHAVKGSTVKVSKVAKALRCFRHCCCCWRLLGNCLRDRLGSLCRSSLEVTLIIDLHLRGERIPGEPSGPVPWQVDGWQQQGAHWKLVGEALVGQMAGLMHRGETQRCSPETEHYTSLQDRFQIILYIKPVFWNTPDCWDPFLLSVWILSAIQKPSCFASCCVKK